MLRSFMRWLTAWSPRSLARRAAELDAREERLATAEQILHNRCIAAYENERAGQLSRQKLLAALNDEAAAIQEWWDRYERWAAAHGTTPDGALMPPRRARPAVN